MKLVADQALRMPILEEAGAAGTDVPRASPAGRALLPSMPENWSFPNDGEATATTGVRMVF